MLVRALSEVVVAFVVAWFVGALILRLVAISCAITATALLAIGDAGIGAPAGVATYGLGCWLVAQLLHRARRGYWRSAMLAHVLSRAPQPATAHSTRMAQRT